MFVTAVVLFTACDVVLEEDRLIPVKLEPETSERKVLLVEFTGQNCVNCPTAAAEANMLLNGLPDNLIVVAMHPAGLGFVREQLASEEAMEYLREFGGSVSTALPTGLINCCNFGSSSNESYLQGYSLWSGLILKERAKAPDCLVDLTYSKEDKHQVLVTLTPKVNMSYDVSLQLWLLENNIQGFQASKGNQYVHNHIFRKSINSLWGEELGVISGLTTKEYSFDIESKYEEKNCSVVAVLIKTDTKEVVQASEIALGEVLH